VKKKGTGKVKRGPDSAFGTHIHMFMPSTSGVFAGRGSIDTPIRISDKHLNTVGRSAGHVAGATFEASRQSPARRGSEGPKA
jgi:hypothetical protein